MYVFKDINEKLHTGKQNLNEHNIKPLIMDKNQYKPDLQIMLRVSLV